MVPTLSIYLCHQDNQPDIDHTEDQTMSHLMIPTIGLLRKTQILKSLWFQLPVIYPLKELLSLEILKIWIKYLTGFGR